MTYVVKASRGEETRILLLTEDPEQAGAFAEGQAIKMNWDRVGVYVNNHPKPCMLSQGEGPRRKEFYAEWVRS